MKGFTVLEMIIVLIVITIVYLITIPNIQQKRNIINEKGCDALLEVVNSQILLYELENNTNNVSIETLIQEGYLKEKQGACPSGKKIIVKNGEAKLE